MLIWKHSDGEGSWIWKLTLCGGGGGTVSQLFDYDNLIDDTVISTCFIITGCLN